MWKPLNNEIDKSSAREIISKIQGNPLLFHGNILGIPTDIESIKNGKGYWKKQQEIIMAVKNNKRVAIKSCHTSGKTFVIARVALEFLYCNYPSQVILTAPTGRQARDILWAELSSGYRNSVFPLGGELQANYLRPDPLNKKWFATAFSTEVRVAEEVSEAIKGYHCDNILYILDEASGIHPKVRASIEAGLSSAGSKIICIGNPDMPSGHFYECFSSPSWKTITISAFDTPNFTGEGNYPQLISREWVEDKRREWGEEHPYWYSKILGEFPRESDDTLVGLSAINKVIDIDVPISPHKVMAIDVARFGRNSTVFTIQHGRKALKQIERNLKDATEIHGEALYICRNEGIDCVGVDGIGVGGPIVDFLRRDGIKVIDINVAESSRSPDYCNLRAEIYWELAKDIKNMNISIPSNCPKLVSQLIGIKYGFQKGKILIESKDSMEKRGLKSPDNADSLAMANYVSKMYSVGKKIKDDFHLGKEMQSATQEW